MLTVSDVMAGKVVVQLGLAKPDVVRAALRAIDAEPEGEPDLVNRLWDQGAIDSKAIERIRRVVALYQHVRNESSYARLAERHAGLPKAEIAQLIAGLEKTVFRRRLGEVLVRRDRITKAQDQVLLQAQHEGVAREDRKALEKYRREDFEGVQRPLVPGSRTLDPEEIKISTLFRSKETQALVLQADIASFLAEERQIMEAEQARTLLQGGPDLDDEKLTAAVQKAATTEALPVTAADLEAAEYEDAEDEPPVTAKGMDRVRALRRIGDYTVVELLGAGGMGAVFLAQKEGRGEYAAVKVMLNEATADEEKARFKREIELTKNLWHRNVISVIDSGTTPDGLTYLVVPALAGKELRAYLKGAKGQGLAPDLACHVFEQMLEGMQAVHDAKIVHRDLKPENVFVLAGEERAIKIMDFGLAKLADEGEGDRSGSRFFKAQITTRMSFKVMGSPAYVAPESITGDPVDARTDIYSLGVTFFEMLTGMRPLESDSPQDFLVQHVVAPPLTLRDARPERAWPKEADQLLARMLAKTRDERPASCREILGALRGGLRAALARTDPGRVAPALEKDTKQFGAKGLLGRLWGH